MKREGYAGQLRDHLSKALERGSGQGRAGHRGGVVACVPSRSILRI